VVRAHVDRSIGVRCFLIVAAALDRVSGGWHGCGVMTIYEQNRRAWDEQVREGNMWTQAVGPEVIARARGGDWSVLLTPEKPVPRAWFGELRGKDVLGLASGGGQQCPIFAAAGARVTSFDASDEQLAQDRRVAEREGLALRIQQGDMRDLSVFADASFDVVFNPCSTCFVAEVEPVWREVARVLRPGGALLTGFVNPWFYLFDEAAFDRGELVVSNSLPVREQRGSMVEMSHSFEAQIGGQLRAGLVLTDLFEDTWAEWKPLHRRAPLFLATRASKPR
jgi:SAM-dependent methyltransferase